MRPCKSYKVPAGTHYLTAVRQGMTVRCRMTSPLARLRAIAGAVAAWCNPDRLACLFANETHEPLDEEDQ